MPARATRFVVSTIAVAASLTLATSAIAAPTRGVPDPGFNGGNPRLAGAPVSGKTWAIDDLLVDGNGRIVTVGGLVDEPGSAAFARYLPDSGLDPAFGSGGRAAGSMLDYGWRLRGVARDGQGRLATAGDWWQDTASETYGQPAWNRPSLLRVSATGQPDTSVGPRGLAQINWLNSGASWTTHLVSVVGASDGSVTLAGRAVPNSSCGAAATTLARFGPSGQPDLAFGSSGRVHDADPAAYWGHQVIDLVPRGSQRVMVLGTASTGAGCGTEPKVVFLTAYAANGARDATFGTGGIVTFDPSASPGADDALLQPRAAAAAPDGGVFVVGESDGGIFVTKRTATGAPAPGFPTFRRSSLQAAVINASSATVTQLRASAVTVQADGRVLVAGSADFAGTRRLLLLRLNANGTLDSTFGDGTPAPGGAVVVVSGTLSAPLPRAIALSGTTKAVVGGDALATSAVGRQGFLQQFVVRTAADVTPPANLGEPVLRGTPSPGQTLTCEPGEWSGNPTSVGVVWELGPRDATGGGGASWVPVAGTARTREVLPGEIGSRLRCREVAVNADGSATAASASLRVDAGPPVNVTPPTVSGAAITRQELVCDPGEWREGPDLTYRWLADGNPLNNTSARHVVQEQDRGKRLACEVTGSNDLGASAPVVTGGLLAVGGPPTNLERPVVSVQRTGSAATSVTLSCAPGRWREDDGPFTYRWLRDDSEVAGATGATYQATIDDLGRSMRCSAAGVNVAGAGTPALSAAVLVPLPSEGPEGKIYQAGAYNRFDPVNMLAVPPEQIPVLSRAVVAKLNAALQATRRRCASGQLPKGVKRQPIPKVESVWGQRVSLGVTCGILADPAQPISINETGVYWQPTPFCARLHNPSPGDAELLRRLRYSPDGRVIDGGRRMVSPTARVIGVPRIFQLPACPQLNIAVPVADPRTPLAISPEEQATLDATRVKRVLWDFNDDGRVDLTCTDTAPVMRTLPEQGRYRVRAVLVTEEAERTGVLPVASHELIFHPPGSDLKKRGTMRPAQPFSCRTSADPPAERTLPCTARAEIGRTVIEGNLCPISLRRLPEREIDGLPDDVKRALEGQAFDEAAAGARLLERFSRQAGGGPFVTSFARSLPGATAVNALSGFSDVRPFGVAAAWDAKLKQLPGSAFNYGKQAFALDQIYVGRGPLKINGIDTEPLGDSALALVPSDVKESVKNVNKMVISASNVASQLGGIPLGDPGRLKAELRDRVDREAAQLFKAAELDAMAKSLKDKLKLGPFTLAGKVEVKLEQDGTATLTAMAEIPLLSVSPGSKPVRTQITVRGDRSGKLSLQGVRLAMPRAYIGVAQIVDLLLDYNAGSLSVKGKLLFPPVNAGVEIADFRINDSGGLQALRINYLAGAGNGIPAGPGVFITKLGGGFSLDPDEIRADTSISVGPSTGGGCPSAGMNADFTVHFGPQPFWVRANGTVVVACFPLVDMNFYADSTGYVELGAGTRRDIELGPIYLNASFGGKMKMPHFEVTASGGGGIRHLLDADVKAIISNRGVAGCGSMEVDLLLETIRISGGAGVSFRNGPPLSLPQLVAALDLFTGCDLSSWSPFGTRLQAGAGGERTFTLTEASKVVGLQLLGQGGVPRVLLRAPDGKVFDLSNPPENLTSAGGVAMLAEPARARLTAFIPGIKGQWTITPAAGSPPIGDVRSSEILPRPKITAKVSGRGARRELRYDVARIAGQEVRFVERGARGERTIATVRGGGKGRKRFLTSEGPAQRREIVAVVTQDGVPRDSLTVARFRAPGANVGRASRLRVSGRNVRWKAAPFARRYEVVVETTRGSRTLLATKGSAARVKAPRLRRGERIRRVTVRGVSESGAIGRAVTATFRARR